MSDPDNEASVRHPGHADGLKLAIGLCLCYTLCIGCLRAYIRWRAYGIDDLFVVLSGILALGFFGTVYASVSVGLGRPLTELDLHSSAGETLNNYALAGNILWIMSLCVSKIVIVAMLLRTTQTQAHRRAQYGVGALIVVQCLTSIIVLTANCSLGREFTWLIDPDSTQCPGKEIRWQVVTALDVTTEVFLLFLPLQLVWRLQMSLRNKHIVISAFWLRLPTIVFSVLRQNETHKLVTASDITLTAATVVIWQAVELSYSLAAATIAALKRFTESLNTGFGHGELVRVHGSAQAYKMSDRSGGSSNTEKSHGNSARSKGPESNVDPVSHRTSRASSSLEGHGRHLKLRPEQLRNTATISSPPKNSGIDNRSIDDAGSEICFIRQELQYSVHYDEAPKGRTNYR